MALLVILLRELNVIFKSNVIFSSLSAERVLPLKHLRSSSFLWCYNYRVGIQTSMVSVDGSILNIFHLIACKKGLSFLRVASLKQRFNK